MICLLLMGLLPLVALTAGQNIQKTSFSCAGRPTGYYADVGTGCQVYHMCDGLGRQFSYSCPNTTLFQQRMLICDHWYMVNCSRSETDYSANLLIGQRGKPFVDDADVQNPYHRTPRPDLLTHPSMPIYKIASRSGKAYSSSNDLNLVGVDSDYDQNNGSSSKNNKPSYFVPSHWSINFEDTPLKAQDLVLNNFNDKVYRGNKNKQSTAPSNQDPIIGRFSTSSKLFTRSTTPAILEKNDEESETEVPVNFKSQFKNTTPVYPEKVAPNVPLPPGEEIGLVPPTSQQPAKETSNVTPEQDEIQVNFKSDFKATTPNYPKVVQGSIFPPGEQFGLVPPSSNGEITTVASEILKEPTQEPEITVNFNSTFKATTPNYPKTVDPGVPLPPGENIGLLPPLLPYEINDELMGNTESTTSTSVNYPSSFKATTPNYPKVVNSSVPLPPGDVIGVLPPLLPQNISDSIDIPSINLELEAPSSQENPLPRNSSELLDYVMGPSKFYQPPKFLPDYTSPNFQQLSTSTTENPEIQWQDLRAKLLIPDYDFPLDTASRPGYESNVDSFLTSAPAGFN